MQSCIISPDRLLERQHGDVEGAGSGRGELVDAIAREVGTTRQNPLKDFKPRGATAGADILDELRATAYSTICPHGRPVMLRLTRREIEKNFDRI